MKITKTMLLVLAATTLQADFLRDTIGNRVDMAALKKYLRDIPHRTPKEQGLYDVLLWGFDLKEGILNDKLLVRDLEEIAKKCQHVDPIIMRFLLKSVAKTQQGIPKGQTLHYYEDLTDFVTALRVLSENPHKECSSCQEFKNFLELYELDLKVRAREHASKKPVH